MDTNVIVALEASNVAIKFAEQAANLLSHEGFAQLLKSLKSPGAVLNGDLNQSQQKVDAALEEFYSNEAIVSGCDRDRLSCLGGPPGCRAWCNTAHGNKGHRIRKFL